MRCAGQSSTAVTQPRSRSIEVFRRCDQGWLLSPVASDAPLVLESLEFSCDQDAVYEDVVFD
jgi:hypothetical protein